jgi:WD40 repeat protein
MNVRPLRVGNLLRHSTCPWLYNLVTGLVLSFDGTLLVSASLDDTIKVWAFQSRQLLASFDGQDPFRLILSPDARQLAYMIDTKDDCKICICNAPPDVLTQARVCIPQKHLLLVR